MVYHVAVINLKKKKGKDFLFLQIETKFSK